MAHNESCKECKTKFLKALRQELGKVTEQWVSGWPTQLEDVIALPFITKPAARKLTIIYRGLQRHRKHQVLVKKPKLQPCDYYVEAQNCFVEFDESQHFTAPRGITLDLYPRTRALGYRKNEWRNRCNCIDRHDNRPAYRDEQRAWFDTLRDLLPSYSGMNPTVRVWAKDMVWCQQSIPSIRLFLRENYFNRETIKPKVEKMKKNYKKTVAVKHPEYVEKRLLLANAEKSGLFCGAKPEEHHIEVYFDTEGHLTVYQFDRNLKREEKQTTLRALGRKLGLKDATVSQMLKYLVTPEMEVERILNCLRYKYLEALSCTSNPGNYITAECNGLFKAMGGFHFRGTNKANLKNKHKQIMRKHGIPSSNRINLVNEQQEMSFIIQYMRNICFNNGSHLKEKQDRYKELIAIKPGAHEIYMDLFNGDGHWTDYSAQKTSKSKYNVLKMMHNVTKRNYKINIEKVNTEIKAPSYLTYATCHITEGPFIFRKNISVTYFEDLKKINEREDVGSFKSKFHYLDYYGIKDNLSNKKSLKSLLKSAERFTKYMT